MGTKFGRKNPSPDQRVTHCWDQRLCRGQARVNQRSNTLGDAGVIRGHSEGNCLEMHKAIKCSQCYRALCSCRCSSKVKNNWPHTSKKFDFRRSITSLWKLLWVKTFQIWVSLNETFNLIYSFLCFDENWNFTFFTYIEFGEIITYHSIGIYSDLWSLLHVSKQKSEFCECT